MREIVLDTETTGLDPEAGHRLVELGCVELVNHIPSGATYHVHINPERDVPPDAFAVHGLSTEFLKAKPTFAAIAADFLAFVADAPFVIHNAAFDMAFLNAELKRIGLAPFPAERAIDTLALSRRRHPAGPHSLDQLCIRYGIDNSRRVKHGALTDAELLAAVYLELIGGRQPGLILAEETRALTVAAGPRAACAPRPTALVRPLSEAERDTHAAFVRTLGENALWRKYEAD